MEQKIANIAVLVSGGGTNLQAILDAQSRADIHSGKVSLVVSNRADAYALQRAANAGVPSVTVLKKQCAGQEDFEQRIMDELDRRNIDLIVLAGFMSILSQRFTSHYERRIINVHPALIPSFCGAGFYGLKVHEAALAKGVKVTGATVHFVNELPDEGEIIQQKAVRVYPGDTPERLQKRVMRQAEWKILPAAVETLCAQIVKEKG